MATEKGKGSTTAKRANAKAEKDGEKNPRKSSAAQAELGRKGAKAKKDGTSKKGKGTKGKSTKKGKGKG